MNEEIFIEKNKERWQKLADYNKRLTGKKIESLPIPELREFTELFRITGHHLAYARTHYSGGKTVSYLNQLVGNSHNYFYTRERLRISAALDYFRYGFPQMVRDEFRLFWISFAAFFIGGIFIFLLCTFDPSMLRFFLPGEITELGGDILSETWIYPILSSVIITNNIRVAIMAFAFGFLAGIGTLYILIFNGAIIGAYVYAVSAAGLSMATFWSLILPHGVIELIAIFICGAAGLIIGRAILIPERLRRKDALISAAKRASAFIPGVAFMLVIAGLIEGFFTPLGIAYSWKFLFAGLTFVFSVAYFILCGRRKSADSG